ncbi:MAG: hypothetical protein AB1706_01990 [Pseudomonadota bacterium]
MKKLIFCTIALTLSGCQSTYVQSQSNAKESVNKFDGKKTLTTKMLPAWTKASWMNGGVGFSGFASVDKPEYMVVEVTFINSISNMEKLFLNIDGQTTEYFAMSKPTDISFGQATRIGMSKRGFLVPVADIKKFNNSQSVKFRVTTLSDGSREGELVRDGKLSQGATSLINIANKL